eukprot:11834_1
MAMNSQIRLSNIFQFPPSSFASPTKIPYSSLLPNLPLTPHSTRTPHNVVNVNIPNITIPNFCQRSPHISIFDTRTKNIISPNQNETINNTIENDSKTSTPNCSNNANISKENNMKQAEILAAIEIEKKNTVLKTQKLAQLHEKYNAKLRTLKAKLAKIKQKSAIIDHINGIKQPQSETLENILEDKQQTNNSFILTQTTRIHDAQQLKLVDGQNANLKAIVESLSKQLCTTINKYQALSTHESLTYNYRNKRNQYTHKQGFSVDCSNAMSSNTHFQNMLSDNRRLERQIKFLRHIIERETERNKFNDV